MIYIAINIFIWVATIMGFVIYNLNKKNEKLENIARQYQYQLEQISEIVEESSNMLAKAELTEAFASDDQIGGFFKNLIAIQESLNHFKLK